MARNHLTLKQYKGIDLLLITFVTLVFEWIIVKASTTWFSSELYTVSVVPAMSCVCFMRWGFYGVFIAIWGALVNCFFNRGEGVQYLIYGAGNVMSVLCLFLFKFVGKKKIAEKTSRAVLFGVLVTLLMQTGRMLCALILGFGFNQSLEFVTTDSLTLVFTAFLIFIARRQDGLFEDQINYLKRINNNPEEELHENNC